MKMIDLPDRIGTFEIIAIPSAGSARIEESVIG